MKLLLGVPWSHSCLLFPAQACILDNLFWNTTPTDPPTAQATGIEGLGASDDLLNLGVDSAMSVGISSVRESAALDRTLYVFCSETFSAQILLLDYFLSACPKQISAPSSA